jgi:hypothetical protein
MYKEIHLKYNYMDTFKVKSMRKGLVIQCLSSIPTKKKKGKMMQNYSTWRSAVVAVVLTLASW